MSTALANKLNGKVSRKTKQTPAQTEHENTIAMTETAIVPVSSSDYLALTSNALDIINENLKNQPLSYAMFDIIKSPSGGITSFSVPGLSGEVMEKELTGIILDYTTPRAYWDTPDPVEGTPPVCWSSDSLVSHLGEPCARCQFNDYGSKNGGETAAKACKENVQIFLLRPDNIMPVIVRVPVSSKLIFQKYMTRLVGKMLPLSGVVTQITLEKKTSREGKPYAQYHFEAVGSLSPGEAVAAKTFGAKFTEILNNSVELSEEVGGDE